MWKCGVSLKILSYLGIWPPCMDVRQKRNTKIKARLHSLP